MEIWIGTSGYAYPDWVGGFYPPGTSSARMLPYYVTRFPLVELNYTFYRVPGPEELARLAERTPAGFQFVVKLHQSLTHEHQFANARPFRQALESLARRGQLLMLLAQYPQRFHHDSSSLNQLQALADRFAGFSLAVEFRHVSWHQPEVEEWLRERGLHLVSVDAPTIPALYPSGLVQSGRLLYARFHSRRISSWYASDDKNRYDYLYSDEELREWLNALRSRVPLADRALLLFNNCLRSQAAVNAQRLAELLRGLGPNFQVVEPFAPPLPDGRQGQLF